MLLIGSLTVLLSACGTAGDIEIHDPWVRPTAQGENAAIYFQLHNHSQNADELVGASSNLADVVEIHESRQVDDVMQMNMVPSVPVGADEEVTFAPGGLHLMLIKPLEEILPGQLVSIKFKESNGTEHSLTVKVKFVYHSDSQHDYHQQ